MHEASTPPPQDTTAGRAILDSPVETRPTYRDPAGGHNRPRPEIVIIGGGFAGMEVAKALGRAGIEATLIDRHNHHLFQPLLYQVATAALSAPNVAEPIRRILRKYRSIQILFGDVIDIDPERKLLTLDDDSSVPYDILIVATGSKPSYFGHQEWEAAAPGLKTIADARNIRTRLLLAFEHAERARDPDEQRRLTTFAVIGGGPTGVEIAGSIAELSRRTLARDFRTIRPENTRILLVEAADRLLAGFSDELSNYARRGLERLKVEVVLGKAVEAIEPGLIKVGGEMIPVGLTIWAAGVKASELPARLGVPLDKQGRVRVDQNLQVSGCHDVFALGDIASFAGPDGKPLPGLAQVAKQQGIHLGKGLARRIATGIELTPFSYRSRGNTAIIGRHAAVFETGRVKLKGAIAWLAWALIHVYLLAGLQHRVLVAIQWLWRYLTYERGARLIDTDRQTTGTTSRAGSPGVGNNRREVG